MCWPGASRRERCLAGRGSPAAINDQVDDDVLAEEVAVLERDIDRALDVCNALDEFRDVGERGNTDLPGSRR